LLLIIAYSSFKASFEALLELVSTKTTTAALTAVHKLFDEEMVRQGNAFEICFQIACLESS
jgi:hypothetical protein